MNTASPRALVLLLATLWIPACGGSDSTGPGTRDPDPPADPVPASVEVTPAADSLATGESLQLDAEVKDASGATLAGEAVTWSSSDEAVATVSGSGEVTAVSDGLAEITATAGSASGGADVSVFTALAEITDAGGTVASGDGSATLEVPAGALAQPAAITVSPADAAAVAVGAVPGTAWEFGPDGLAFATPATMTLAYDVDSLPAGADESTLALVRFDGTTLERLAGVVVDPDAGTVQAPVPGFSSFAVCLPSEAASCGGLPQTDISASMEASRGPVDVGDTLTYTLTLTNEGPDLFPGGRAALTASGPVDYPADFTTPAGCSLGSGGTAIGFACDIGALGVGGSAIFQLRAQATAGGEIRALGGPFQLPSSTDPEVANDTARVSTSVNFPDADLSYSVTSDPAELNGGQSATFTFSVNNPASVDARDVDYLLSFFGDVTPASSWTVPEGCELGNTVEGGADLGIRCRSVTAPAQGTVSRQITVDIGAGETSLRLLGVIVDVGTVIDPDATNNEVDRLLAVTPQPVASDLSYAVDSDPTELNGGQSATFTLSVDNPASSAVEGVSYFLSIFGDVRAASGYTAPDGCTLSGPVQGGADIGILCGPADVPAGGSVNRDLTVDIAGAETSLRLLGGIADPGNADDPDLANNEVDRVVPVTPAPVQTDLAIDYALNPVDPVAGGEVSATITISNLGQEDAAEVVWVLNFNNGVTETAGYVTPSGCQLGSPADASVDGTGLLCSGVTVPAGGTASETLNLAVADTASLIEVVGGIQSTGTVEDTNTANNSISETVTVQPATQDPLIVLDPDSVAFDVVQGAIPPNPLPVAILNGGGGSLAGLDAGVLSYGQGQPTGWLQASYFTDGVNDFALVQADQSGLSEGTYTATVQVTDPSASNSPVNLPVVLNVLPAADIEIVLATPPASVDVGTTIDYEVTVTNNGPGQATDVVFILAVSGTLLSPGPEFTPQGCGLFTSPPDADPAKVYQCTIPSMAAGATQSFTLPLIPQVSGEVLDALAQVSGLEGAADPDPTNDLSGGQTTVN